jgi:molybdopterin/thiamine biosynthesis adenylyltransferase
VTISSILAEVDREISINPKSRMRARMSVIHGTGWNAFLGAGPSPLPEEGELNCIGSSLAVIVAASQLFAHSFEVPQTSYIANAFNWRSEAVLNAPGYDATRDLGNIWTVGVGSVGTAALYFLSLATRNFTPTLIDMDLVKLHNLDRSPVFAFGDIRLLKVDSARDYLKALGITNVRTDDRPLHESRLWNERQAGEADLVIAAANEKKVRYYIEAGFPPMQLYGTTGQNWQAALIRHEPFGKACSLCLFPNDQEATPTACATAPEFTQQSDYEKVDAALPFLSFADGLMTAAEVLKLKLPGYPFSPDRVILGTRPKPSLVSAPLQHRSGCLCEHRNKAVHRAMLSGSRYRPPEPKACS